MSKLKITDVQVDCRELTQEQIDKMCEIVERKRYTKSYDCPNLTLDLTYLSINQLTNYSVYGFYSKDSKCTTVSYDEFINLFDKPKFKPKKAIKELGQRIALLERKLSEKEVEDSVNEAVNGLPIVIEVGMRFRHFAKKSFVEIKRFSNRSVGIYFSDTKTTIDISDIELVERIKQGIWIPLPLTEKKESELTKGAICKFWNDDENSYEIGRYEETNNFGYINIFTLEGFKNAKVISVDEALQLFKKQLLNGK